MERICHWRDVWKEELCNVESPFFAQSIVESSIQGDQALPGVRELLKACHLPEGRYLSRQDILRVSYLIDRADWLLVRDQAFSPIDITQYHALSWFRSRLDSLMGDEFSGPTEGAGKWKTFSIDVDVLKSGVAFAANFITSRGDEGRLFASEGKDYANTRRIVSQRWVRLEHRERNFANLSAVHRYGEVREITQNYVEADDHWAISGTSWHWRPVVADEEYEFGERIS